MLAIARALLTNPKLLAMDEPSEGLAPVVVDQLIEAIQRLGTNGLAILLIEQSLDCCIQPVEPSSQLWTEAALFTKGRAANCAEMPGDFPN